LFKCVGPYNKIMTLNSINYGFDGTYFEQRIETVMPKIDSYGKKNSKLKS